MTKLAYERLHENLCELKLTMIDEMLDNYLEIAARDSISTLEVLNHLVEAGGIALCNPEKRQDFR